jgi:CheY-like chemotaxis protein
MRAKKKMILAVDDTTANLQLIQETLRGEYDLRLAKNGLMAKNTLDNYTPDLVLLDIEMPGMSGFDLMDYIKDNNRLKDVPVIFVTSHVTVEFIQMAGKRGAKGYVAKPFKPETLRDKVREALGL